MSAPTELPRIAYKPCEVAHMIGMDQANVRRYIRAGQIPADKYGSTYRIPAWWVQERLTGPSTPDPNQSTEGAA